MTVDGESSEVPDPLERVLLALVSQSGNKASWHWLATHLPRHDVPSTPDLMTALKELQRRNLLQRLDLGNGLDRWSLTEMGQLRLVQLETEREPLSEGPLHADELVALLAALRAGAEKSIAALIPHVRDDSHLIGVLDQVLDADVSLAERVAFGGAMLTPAKRGEFARKLLDDSRPLVRRAVFTSLHAKRMGVRGQAVRTLPEAEWDELLRQGLRDSDATVRGAAAALIFASDRGRTLKEALLASLSGTTGAEREVLLLALSTSE